MSQPVIAARIRKNKGKGAARKLRKNNQIPAIFYGPKTEPVMLTVDYSELKGVMKRGTAENVVIDLQVQSDQGTETRKAMLKDLLMDPVKDTFIHADFYEISMDKKITVGVPIRLVNTPVGAAEGGILQHVRRELTISCMPGKLIDFLDIDVSGLNIGDSLHVRDIELPEGITTAEEEHLTVAVVAAPTVTPEVVEEEVEAEEAVTEEEAESTEESAEES
jgi:large subunit ribosomal protein L25